MKAVDNWSITDAGSTRNAWVLWWLFTLMIMVIVAWAPESRSVTPNYREAAHAWFAGEAMYHDLDNIHGYLYLPQAALLYAPLLLLPLALGEALGRLIMMGLFAMGAFRLAQCEDRAESGKTSHGALFAILTLASLPLAIANGRNGQFNLVMAGVWMLGAAALGGRRWWWAAFWIGLSVMIKPTGLVLALLVAAVWWRTMLWRLAIVVAAMLAAPFLLQRPSYVLEQYHLFFLKLTTASAPPLPEWYDINGILENGLGLQLPSVVLTAIRGLAALGTLAMAWLATRRFALPAASLLVFVLAVVYIMLFNPRTEGPTYLLLMPAMGLFIGWAFFPNRAQKAMGKFTGWPTGISIGIALIAAVVLINFSYNLFNLLDLAMQLFVAPSSDERLIEPKQYWLRPLLALVFAGYVIWLVMVAKPKDKTVDAQA